MNAKRKKKPATPPAARASLTNLLSPYREDMIRLRAEGKSWRELTEWLGDAAGIDTDLTSVYRFAQKDPAFAMACAESDYTTALEELDAPARKASFGKLGERWSLDTGEEK